MQPTAIQRHYIMFHCFCVAIIFIGATALVQGTCDVPTRVYEGLKCKAMYDPAIKKDCPVKYDCSHIYDRPANTCHFKGKSYKVGEQIDNEELVDVWDRDCACTASLKFECPEYTDGCAEDWVGDYPKAGCYLRHELNSYCGVDEICPPFDGNAKCEVGAKTYREGDMFTHPENKCAKCVCNKGFEGKFEAPFCQPVNCTKELKNTEAIDNHCAPYYDHTACCPTAWVCPHKDGKFTDNPAVIPKNQPASEYFCKFGDHIMHIGDYYESEDENLGSIYCTCNIPPFATCKSSAVKLLR